MKIPALRYVPDPLDMDLHVSHLEFGSSQDLEQLRESNTPVMYLIPKTDLTVMRQLGSPVIDRGVKNEHKGLSGYLLHLPTDKIPFIDGNYKASRQLIRSIRTTMLKAMKSGKSLLFIVGIEDNIFRELWNKIEDSGKLVAEETGKVSIDGTDANESSTRFLLHLFGRRKEPQTLVERYVGRSMEVQLVRHLILFAAKSDDTVLILGNTGTGKELVAREIHRNGPRMERPFISVNCGAIPKELFESEVFGFVKGSFSGATITKPGLWEIARNGTLFLDEIGDLLPLHQAKILRALEEGMILPVGAIKEIKVGARVIAATNRDLFSMVQSGQFREDLYYRLRGFTIRTPSLKDHKEDIPLLSQALWRRITQNGEAMLPDDILNELESRQWPGNARELKMVLSNLRGLFGTEDLRIEHLRAVFYLGGQSIVQKEEPKPENAVALHRAECLQQLKRVNDVIHVVRSTLLSVVLKHKINKQILSSVRSGLGLHLNELDMLIRRPLLFHSQSCFSLVSGLKERLAEILSLLEKNKVEQVHKLWEEELENIFTMVTSNLFQEVEKVLEKT